MSRFEANQERQKQRLAGSAGVSVTYYNGSTSRTIIAVPAPREYAVDSGDGLVTMYQSDDWLVDVADVTQPKRADTIKRTYCGVETTWSVTSVPGRPVAEPSGPSRWRIHTKRTEVDR